MVDDLFSVVIVDDEPPARAKLCHYVAQYPRFKVIGEAATGADAIKLLTAQIPDVLFLDISLPDLSGFDVIRQRPVPPECSIVFATAHEQHALRAFDAQALDYLVKPISPVRFAQLMQRIERQMIDKRDAVLGREMRQKSAAYTDRLICRSGSRSHLVPVKRIAFIEAARNYVVVHVDSETHVLRRTLESLESSLDPALFVRISRSVIVNRSFIKTIQVVSHGDHDIELTDGRHLTWTRKYHHDGQLV